MKKNIKKNKPAKPLKKIKRYYDNPDKSWQLEHLERYGFFYKTKA